jgi:hypothetical protein
VVTPDTIRKFFSSLQGLGVTPRDGFVLDAAVPLWVSALGDDVTDAELRASAILWARSPEGRWWPTPGDVVRIVAGAKGPRMVGEDLWSIVMKYGKHFGMYRLSDGTVKPAIFKDPEKEAMAQEAVRMVGGWQGLLLAQEDELPHVRRHWCAAFDRIAERASQSRDGALFGAAVNRIEQHQAQRLGVDLGRLAEKMRMLEAQPLAAEVGDGHHEAGDSDDE